jgi:hypothetical protein
MKQPKVRVRSADEMDAIKYATYDTYQTQEFYALGLKNYLKSETVSGFDNAKTEGQLLSTLEILDKDIERHSKRLEELKNSREVIASLKIKRGDAVYHTKLGNCLISGIYVSEGGTGRVTNYESGTVVADVKTLNGSTFVPINELIEINATTKILYDSNKVK